MLLTLRDLSDWEQNTGADCFLSGTSALVLLPALDPNGFPGQISLNWHSGPLAHSIPSIVLQETRPMMSRHEEG